MPCQFVVALRLVSIDCWWLKRAKPISAMSSLYPPSRLTVVNSKIGIDMKIWHLFWGWWRGLGILIQAAINNTRLGAMFGGQPLMAAFVSFTVGALLLCLVSLLFVDWQTVQSGLSDIRKSVTGGNGLRCAGRAFLFCVDFLAPKSVLPIRCFCLF